MSATKDDLSDHAKPAFDKYVAEHGEPGCLHYDSRTVVIWDKGQGDEPHKIYDSKTLEEITIQDAVKRGARISRSEAALKF
jgi:hypothetical protein